MKELNKNFKKANVELSSEAIGKIKNTVYCIEGNHFDTWKKWHQSMEYLQHYSGNMYVLGYFADMPVTISIGWASYNGQLVMFYSSDSMVTYHEAVLDFLETIFEKHSDHPFRTTNSQNDHIAISHVEKLAGITRKSIPYRKFESEVYKLECDNDVLFQIYQLDPPNFKKTIYNLRDELAKKPAVAVKEPLDYNDEPFKYFN